MQLNNDVDELGISKIENLQIDALKAGATPEDVASLSRQTTDEIPTQHVSSEFEDTSAFTSDISEYAEAPLSLSSKEAARKALPASLATDEDTESSYTGMYDQYTTAGTSTLFDSVKKEVRDRSIRDLEGYIKDSAREGDVDGTQALIAASPRLLEEESDIDIAGMRKAAQSFTEASDGPRRREAQAKFLRNMVKNKTAKDAVNRVIDTAVADSSGDLGTFAADATEQAFLGEQALGLSKVGEDILGERYVFEGGTMIRDLAQKLRDLPVEQQEAEAQRIVDSFTKHSGSVKNNDLVKVFALETFREFANTPGGDKPFDRWITNIVGYSEIASILGATALAKVGKKLIKLGRSPSSLRKLSNSTGELQSANPDLAASLQSEALKSEQVANTLGTTKADELAKAMPSNHIDEGFLLQGAPNSLLDRVKGIKTQAEEAVEHIDNTYLYSPADYKAKMVKLSDVFQDETISAVAKPSYSSITRSNNNNALKTRMVYGDNTDLPLSYTKAQEIQGLIKERFIEEGIKDPQVQIIRKDAETDTYSDIDKLDNAHFLDDAEYLVSADVEVPMWHRDIVGDEVLGKESTQGVGSYAGRFSDVAGNFLKNPQSYMSRNLLGAARVSNDAKFFKSHGLLKVAKPFLTLNYFGKKRVAGLLDVGEAEGKVFKYNELKTRYSEREIEAYYSARYLNDSVYNIKNATVREDLLSQGFKGLTVESAGGELFSNAARQVDNEELLRSTTVAIDPANGTHIKVTEQSINEMAELGLVPVRLLKGVDQGKTKNNFAFVPRDTLHELPQNIFPYREGYNFRINNDPYFIDRLSSKIVDGTTHKDYSSTIGVAKSREEAARYIAKLEEAEPKTKPKKVGPKAKKVVPKVKFKVRLDRNVSSTRSALDNDVLDGSGLQFWFTKRGARLQRLDGSASSVEDPVTAMNRMISSVSNVDTHKELLDTSVLRHRKTYGDLTVDVNGVQVPLWSWDKNQQAWIFDKSVSSVGRPDVAAAKAEYDYLENLKYAPTNVDIAWKQLMEGIDANFGTRKNPLSKAISATTRAASKVSPGGTARGVAFAMTIPLRPIRHLVLQGTTGMSLAGIDPVNTARSFADANLMMISLATYQNPTLWKGTRQMSKLFGHSPDDWEDIFDSFRKSGKAYAIDSHVAVGEANFSWARSLPDNVGGEALRILGNAAKSPITIGKAIGFDTGELANQAMTYMFALRRWKKANPGVTFKDNQKALDEITESARNFSVDMTKTDSFAYQKGLFASAAQFQAINHKMLLKIIGNDPTIPRGSAIHGKYVAGLLTMYGAAGLGLQDFYDSWIKSQDVEIPPEIDDLLYGGFTQALFNKSLELTDDSIRELLGTSAVEGSSGKARTAFADSFAPTSGVSTFAYEFVENLMEGNLVEALAGPSGTVFPNIKKSAQYVSDIWGFSDITTPEKLIQSYQTAFEGFGGFSDYYKLSLAIAYNEKMGTLTTVNKDGRPSVEANLWSEVFAKSLLGLNLRGEQELYSKHVKMWRDVKSTGKKHEAQIDKDAEHLSKYLYETWATTQDPLQVREKMLPITFALHRGDKSYGLEVYKRALEKFRVDPQFELFVNDIVTQNAIFNSKLDFDNMRNSIKNSDAVRDEHKQNLVESIDALESSSEATRTLIDENF